MRQISRGLRSICFILVSQSSLYNRTPMVLIDLTQNYKKTINGSTDISLKLFEKRSFTFFHVCNWSFIQISIPVISWIRSYQFEPKIGRLTWNVGNYRFPNNFPLAIGFNVNIVNRFQPFYLKNFNTVSTTVLPIWLWNRLRAD